MKKIIGLIALMLASFGIAGGTNVQPASAYLTNCSVGYASNGTSGMFSVCQTTVNNGGLNQQRAVLGCYNGITHLYAFTVYGAWKNVGVTSFAYCGVNGYFGGSKSYQLR